MTVTFTANDQSLTIVMNVTDLQIDNVNKLAYLTVDISNYPKLESK